MAVINEILNLPLQELGFSFGHYDKGRNIHLLKPKTLMELEDAVGRGRLLIILNGSYCLKSKIM